MSGPSSKPNRSAVPVVSRVAYWFGTHWEHAACHPEPPWEAVGKQFSFPAAAHRRLVERALAAITLLGDEPINAMFPSGGVILAGVVGGVMFCACAAVTVAHAHPSARAATNSL